MQAARRSLVMRRCRLWRRQRVQSGHGVVAEGAAEVGLRGAAMHVEAAEVFLQQRWCHLPLAHQAVKGCLRTAPAAPAVTLLRMLSPMVHETAEVSPGSSG